MKRNVVWAAVILVGMLCAWNYLAAKPMPEEKTSPQSKLLEIKEPSQEDFEHCAKRAMDFFESMSADKAQMDIAIYELVGEQEEIPPQMSMVSTQLAHLKNSITYAHPELVSKKSFGENLIVLYYRYHTEKTPFFWRFTFARTLDQNGEPLQWRCGFNFGDTLEMFIPPTL